MAVGDVPGDLQFPLGKGGEAACGAVAGAAAVVERAVTESAELTLDVGAAYSYAYVT